MWAADVTTGEQPGDAGPDVGQRSGRTRESGLSITRLANRDSPHITD